MNIVDIDNFRKQPVAIKLFDRIINIEFVPANIEFSITAKQVEIMNTFSEGKIDDELLDYVKKAVIDVIDANDDTIDQSELRKLGAVEMMMIFSTICSYCNNRNIVMIEEISKISGNVKKK